MYVESKRKTKIFVKVSVIIPVYNVIKYLKQCIDSVLNQTMDDIEIIIVDDGSTDGSEILCDDYANKYDCIKVFHRKNNGLGSARNLGIDIATGEYLYFLDSDDWIKEDALKTLYNYAHHYNLDIVFFAAETVCENIKIQEKFCDEEYERNSYLGKVCVGWKGLVEEIRVGKYNPSVCMRLYKAEYFKLNNYKFNENYIHEDEDVAFLSHLIAPRVMTVNDKFYYRRIHDGSIISSKNALNSVQGYYYAWEKLFLYATNSSNQIYKELCYQRCKIYVYLCLNIYREVNYSERKKISFYCKKMCQRQSKMDSSRMFIIASYSMCTYLVCYYLKEWMIKHKIFYK